MFAGISISRFGDLDADTERVEFWIAVGAAAAAMVGTLVSLLTAMSLAAASTVTVTDLTGKPRRLRVALGVARRELAKDPSLAPWEYEIGKLVDALAVAERDYHEQLQLWRDDEAINADRSSLDRAAAKQATLQAVLSTALEAASFLRLQARFRAARWILGASLLTAAAGAAAFVWVTGEETTERIPSELVAATWNVPTRREEEIREALGSRCRYDLSSVPVLVLAEEDGGREQTVATLPSPSCDPVRLVVATDQLIR